MGNDSILKITTDLLLPALGETLIMVFISTIISTVLSFGMAIILIYSYEDGLKPNHTVYQIVNGFCNIFKSLPSIIVALAVIPFTKLIIGTSTGYKAAIVPLVIISTPYLAKMIETAFLEVSTGLVEAAKSMGIKNRDIILGVYINESLSGNLLNVATIMIWLVEASAVAAAIGAGGLGAVAITYGYRLSNPKIIFLAVIVLVVLVETIQWIANRAYYHVKP